MNEKLLIICHAYHTFQKDSIEAISKYFDETTVLVRTNPLAELSRRLPLPLLERYKLANVIDLTRKPREVTVRPTPMLYLPLDRSYKSLGKVHFDHVQKIIRRHRNEYDLVHCHFTWSSGYVGARLKKECGIPFIVTGHGFDIYSLPFKDNIWQEKISWVLNTADQIITVSRSNLACIKKLGISTPITVIPNGFRSDLFYPREPVMCRQVLNLPEDMKIILTVGNLVPIKGQKYLIEAMKAIVQERRDVLCIIIGSGRLRTKLEQQIRSLGLDEFVMLVGGKPHDAIPLWMNACDLFVLPSLHEGNPTVMFEALGCGKPFVGTRVGGVPEVITSDDYGLLVNPTDTEDLAEKILVALDREWNRDKILQYAERYTWENIAKEIMFVYEKVLS